MSKFNEEISHWEEYNYDIILANINRKVLEKLITKFKKAKAKIIISGLLNTDYLYFKNQCDINKLFINNKQSKGEWICLEIYSK